MTSGFSTSWVSDEQDIFQGVDRCRTEARDSLFESRRGGWVVEHRSILRGAVRTDLIEAVRVIGGCASAEREGGERDEQT